MLTEKKYFKMIKVLKQTVNDLQSKKLIPQHKGNIELHPAFDIGVDSYLDKLLYKKEKISDKLLGYILKNNILDQYRLLKYKTKEVLSEDIPGVEKEDFFESLNFRTKEVENIVKLLREGYSRQEISTILNMSLKQIRKLCKESNLIVK